MPSTPGFQTFVNNELPVAIAGDFASANPRATVLSAPGAFVAPVAGTTVGAFAWGNLTSLVAANYYTPGSAIGFVHRENNALITQFLGYAAPAVVGGNMVTLHVQGDFWGVFAAGATVGQKVYANPLTGLLTANTTGNSVTASSTSSSLATTGVLTVGATVTGTIAVGQVVTGAGIPDGSYISAEGTGTGSTGTYQLANANGTAFGVVSAEAVAFWGVQETNYIVASNVPVNAVVTASIAATGIMTVSAVSSGVLTAGQFLTASTLAATANAQILSQLTGTTGGTGTYQTSYNGVVSSTTVTGTQGQLGKITSW